MYMYMYVPRSMGARLGRCIYVFSGLILISLARQNRAAALKLLVPF